MKNNTKLIMETWRRFLKEDLEGIDEDGMVVDEEEEVNASDRSPVKDEDLESDRNRIDRMHDMDDMYGMDDIGEFNPYKSSPIPPSDDDGLVPDGEDSIGPYYTDGEENETNDSSEDPVRFTDSFDEDDEDFRDYDEEMNRLKMQRLRRK